MPLPDQDAKHTTDPTAAARRIPGPWRGVIVLTLTAVVVASVLAVVQQLTGARIADQQQAAINASLAQVIPGIDYDNALHQDRQAIHAAGFFQTDQPLWVHRARRQGRVQALIFDVVTPEGYNGDIRLLIGIDRRGTVTGVRVTRHLETPGLGDAIETDKSNWVERFTGRSLNNTPAAHWQAVRNGNADGFIAISGATVTSSAMVAVVERTLRYVTDNRATLLQAADRPGQEPD